MENSSSRLHLCIRGERALFRNIEIPGTDVSGKVTETAIIGLLGNMMGKWRDFDDPEELDGSRELVQWIEDRDFHIDDIRYEYEGSTTLSRKRYKAVKTFTQDRASGPRDASFHTDVKIDVWVSADRRGRDDIERAVRCPAGIPYLGQSDCYAQVEIVPE